MIAIKDMLLGGTGVLALVAASGAMAQTRPEPPATAQTPAADVGGAADIVVTAQKREQRLLDVPVAITAITSDTLTTQSLNRIQDYYDRVPGLQYSGQRVADISLRGITTGGATNPTVAILVDDVQFGGSTAAGQPPLPDFDAGSIERVEVLRGPQGTLYGAASLGGLIKYVLKQPSTREFSGRVEVGGTTVAHGDEGYTVRGTVNVPVADWLAVTASGFKREDAPYLDNFRTGRQDVNTRDVWGYRGAVLVKPVDALSITLSALRQKQDAINSDLSVLSGGVPICVACTTGGTVATRAVAPTTFEPVYGDLTINVLDSTNVAKHRLYSARAELDVDTVTLTSISAWSKADNVLVQDVSAVFGFLLPFYGSPTGSSFLIDNGDVTTKFSQEGRVSGRFGQFDVLVGAFYTVEHSSINQQLNLIGSNGAIVGTPVASTNPNRYQETAGFGTVTWHPTDRFELQVGGRYSRNKRTLSSISTNDPKVVAVFGPSAQTSTGSGDSTFTYLISPAYHFTPDIMAYIRIANGFRPGGPNGVATRVADYEPDRVVNYELGFKGRVVPGLLTIDTALFQIDWSDIQLQGTSANQLGFTTNGGKARSRGVEFASNLTPWSGMSIDANMAITDAEIIQNLPSFGSGSLRGTAGDRLPYTAKFTGSVTAQQRFDLSNHLDGTFGVNLTHVGDRRGAFLTTIGTRPRILIPGYTTLNLTAGLTLDRDWQLTAFLRNVTDKRGIAVAQNRNGTSVPTALFIQPRTLGLTLARNF